MLLAHFNTILFCKIYCTFLAVKYLIHEWQTHHTNTQQEPFKEWKFSRHHMFFSIQFLFKNQFSKRSDRALNWNPVGVFYFSLNSPAWLLSWEWTVDSDTQRPQAPSGAVQLSLTPHSWPHGGVAVSGWVGGETATQIYTIVVDRW